MNAVALAMRDDPECSPQSMPKARRVHDEKSDIPIATPDIGKKGQPEVGTDLDRTFTARGGDSIDGLTTFFPSPPD